MYVCAKHDAAFTQECPRCQAELLREGQNSALRRVSEVCPKHNVAHVGPCSFCRTDARRAELDEAKRSGCLFYTMPYDLKEGPWLDEKMTPAVFELARSGWCYPAESCSGHPDATEMGAWAYNNSPMMRLVTKKENLGRLFLALYEAYEETARATEKDRKIFEAGGLKIYPRRPEPENGWAEVLVYIEAQNAYQRDQGVEVWNAFARKVSG